MSELGFLEKLLDGAEVEWKPLGDTVRIQRGKRLVKSQLEEIGDFAVFQNSMKPLGYYHESNVEPETAFIICAGAAGKIGYSQRAFWAADDVYFFVPPEGISGKFLFHWLLTQQNKILGQVRRASIPRLSKAVVEKLSFPIPCPNDPEKSLAIQAEIVRILDAFTALTAALTAELTARKKQYNHYRNQLLSFEEGTVEWKTLGEVSSLITKGTTPKSFTQSGVSFIKTEAFSDSKIRKERLSYIDAATHKTFLKRSILEADDILITIAGATIGKIAVVDRELLPANTNQALAIIRLDDTVDMKFIFYLLQSKHMKDYIEKCAKGSAQPNLNLRQLNDFPIPIPPLAEQARIVAILDSFDTLTTSLSEGLPREIALRQKQYEYYRDRLLSFPKPEEKQNG